MKIGILTYYNVHNHGAVLQANALKKVLENLGYEVGFLSFERNYDNTPVELIDKYKFGIKSIIFYYKYLMQMGICNIFYNLKKRNILNRYRKINLPIICRYSDFKDGNVVIGSDEVFSVEIGINPFFYGHGLKSINNVSYAASFGPTSIELIDNYNLRDLIKSGLIKLKAISVRDCNSYEILKSFDLESKIVCDPVILYGYEKEQKEFIPNIKEYIVIYSYDKNMNSDEEISNILNFANKNNFRVISVGYYHKWCDNNINVTPEQLIGYIKNAKFVITDTFHGTVLSLICNTEFAVKLRGNNNKLCFLLDEYNLKNRIITDFKSIDEIFNNNIDYSNVNTIIKYKRENSLNFIKQSLGVE